MGRFRPGGRSLPCTRCSTNSLDPSNVAMMHSTFTMSEVHHSDRPQLDEARDLSHLYGLSVDGHIAITNSAIQSPYNEIQIISKRRHTD